MNKHRKATLRAARAAEPKPKAPPRDYVNPLLTYKLSGADLLLLQEGLRHCQPEAGSFCGLEPKRHKAVYDTLGNIVARALARGTVHE